MVNFFPYMSTQQTISPNKSFATPPSVAHFPSYAFLTYLPTIPGVRTHSFANGKTGNKETLANRVRLERF
jgi:hypothetical protein